MFDQHPPVPIESAAAERAKTSLIEAALNLFGLKGYDATSTRDIAAAARANIASIAYYFTGKEGLRTACAAFVAGKVGGILGAAMPDDARIALMQPTDAEEAIIAVVRAMVRFMVTDPSSEPVARFAIREQMYPTKAFDHLYEGLFEPMHMRLCALWARATGVDATISETKLRVFALIGQIVFFRLTRYGVFRRMEWNEQDAQAHLAEISNVIESNIRTLIKEARQHV